MSFCRQKRKLAAVLAAVCAAALLFCGCEKNESVKSRAVSSINTISAKVSDRSLHFSDPVNPEMELITKSGLLELCFDKESCSFFVHDLSCERYWSSLPVFTADRSVPEDSSAITVTALYGTDLYVLNSQDNSVAYGRASCKKNESGMTLTYDIFPDEATSKKQKLSSGDFAVRAILDISLVDGALNVNCSVKNLSGNPEVTVTDIKLLNSFGAYTESEKDDFLLVPDGCGAIIKTNVVDESFTPLTFPVYGADPSVYADEKDGAANVPAFGMRHSNAAFAALITGGDCSASVYAEKSVSSSGFNRVYAGFTVTPYSYNGKKLFVAPAAGTAEFSVCYRFLSGNNASYAGLASACREQLIRNAVLSNRRVADTGTLPFNLSLDGCVRNNIIGNFGINVKGTDFEQALDMLTRMKNKGINSVNLRYIGALSGGTAQKNAAESFSLSRRLGSIEKLKALYDYAEAQNMKIFLDLDISGAAGIAPSGAAHSVDYKTSVFMKQNPVYPLTGKEFIKYTLRAPHNYEGLALSLLTKAQDIPFTGFCIDDAANVLCSDFSNGTYTSREQMKQAVASTVTPLTVGRSTMVSGAGFYLLKNADVAVSVPDKTLVDESGAYCAIPFVQLILHGAVDYSGAPQNLSANEEETKLKLIEYGACPHYEWSYNPLNSEEENALSWNSGINGAAEYYAAANAVLGDLRGARMTDHQMLSDGVFVTVYDTGARIYVNYTDKDYSASGVVVPAKGYERVN